MPDRSADFPKSDEWCETITGNPLRRGAPTPPRAFEIPDASSADLSCPKARTSVPGYNLDRSHDAFVRATRSSPAGSTARRGPSAPWGASRRSWPGPRGNYLYDIDGHQYIDYIGSWGPMILGHAQAEVREAVAGALELGTSFGAPTLREVEIAEARRGAVPSIEKVRFVSSGTEAAMSAVRVARGVTGRRKIIKMAGHYHGHVDALLVQAGSAATTLGTPTARA